MVSQHKKWFICEHYMVIIFLFILNSCQTLFEIKNCYHLFWKVYPSVENESVPYAPETTDCQKMYPLLYSFSYTTSQFLCRYPLKECLLKLRFLPSRYRSGSCFSTFFAGQLNSWELGDMIVGTDWYSWFDWNRFQVYNFIFFCFSDDNVVDDGNFFCQLIFTFNTTF